MTAETVTIRLSDETRQLFADYERYTRVDAQTYIGELVDKTVPTLRAMVEAFEECQDDTDAVMEVFGRKMGEMMLQQRQASAS